MFSNLKNSFVSQSIAKLHANDDLADFTFTFGRVKVPVHKLILATASPVFRAMFYGQIKDKVSVEITDSNAEAFKEFLQLFYSDDVTLTIENIDEVAKLADKYDMLDCLNECTASLEDQLTNDNMVWGYKLAISLKNDKLKRFCEKRIGYFRKQILQSDAFLRIDRDLLKNVLEMDNLAVDETKVFEACLSWAKYACQRDEIDANNVQNLRAELGDCLYLIRFAAMSFEQLATITAPYKGLLSSDETAEIFYAIANQNADPIRFNKNPRSFSLFDVRQWDSTKALVCACDEETDSNLVDVSKTWVRFSVNIPVLLGELHKKHFRVHGWTLKFCPCIVTIGEIADAVDVDCSVSSTFKKVLFKGEMHLLEPNIVPLTQVLLIQPNKTYEVRFERERSYKYLYDLNAARWKREYKLDDELTVSFPAIDSFNPLKIIKFSRL